MIRKILVAAGTVALLSSTALVPAAHATEQKETYRLLELFGEVFDKVRTEYVEPVKDEDLIEAALNGMLTSLDPHSGYLNPKNSKDMDIQTRGEFGGLGLEVTMESGWVKVVSPIDDTPAARGGMQPGDLITHLDGEPVQGLSLTDAVDRMRGAPGTDIKLTVRRGGAQPFDVKLTRAVIKVQTVKGQAIGDAGYIRISQFSATTETDLRRVMGQVRKELGKNPAGYVIDLRNNPGGLLDQAVAVADDFLEKGEIVSTRSRRPEDTQRYNARSGDISDRLPLVVLINDGSASASEIVAGALQDHKRATIVGIRSFGKGSVQTLIPLPGHGSIRLTTARYYTPSGRSIQAVGIEPDVKVPAVKGESAEPERRSEASLPRALPNPNGAHAPDKDKDKDADKAKDKAKDKAEPKTECKTETPPPTVKFGDPAQDYQLSRALEVLHAAPRPAEAR